MKVADKGCKGEGRKRERPRQTERKGERVAGSSHCAIKEMRESLNKNVFMQPAKAKAELSHFVLGRYRTLMRVEI